MAAVEHVVSVENIAALKLISGNSANMVLTGCALTKGDQLGKFYMYDPISTATEDLVNYNVIMPANSIGRWIANYQRIQTYVHGTLVTLGAFKIFVIASTVTSGASTVNLTVDNTTNGTAIFTEVWYASSEATVDTTTPSDIVYSGRKTLSANKKQLTHSFIRGNTTLLNLSIITTGLTVSSTRFAPDGTPVSFFIVGK